MPKKAKSLLKISSIYVGTVLGAGFASGQELVLFFARFEKRGILGILLAFCLFSFLGGIVLGESKKRGIHGQKEYMQLVLGNSLGKAFSFFTEIFLCISYCIMLSGVGAFFETAFLLPKWVGILLADGLCLLIFCREIGGLAIFNVLLVPCMFVGIVFVSLYGIFSETVPAWVEFIHPRGRFLVFSLLYVGYNLLTATAVLVPAANLAHTKSQAVYGGVLGGIVLGVMGLIGVLALSFKEHLWQTSLPLLLLSETGGRWGYFAYGVVLLMAMLTTAVSAGFSVVENLKNRGQSKCRAVAIVSLGSLPVAFCEFSVLMEKSYIFFGGLGLVFIGAIFWHWYKDRP